MLRDRPAMAQFGEKAAVLYHWARHKFAGEDLHEELFWDPSEPRSCNAESCYPTSETLGRILIRRTFRDGANEGKERSFEGMWANAVFELYNIASGQDFQRLNQQAAEGHLTKETFVVKSFECEYRAEEDHRTFYIHVFLPRARRPTCRRTDPMLWHVAARSVPRENPVLPLVDRRGTYWKYLEDRYDSILLDTLVCKGENRKASELVAKMLGQAATREEQAKVYVRRGVAYHKMGTSTRPWLTLRKRSGWTRRTWSPSLAVATLSAQGRARQGHRRLHPGHPA